VMLIAARQSATTAQANAFRLLGSISGFCNPLRRRSERALPTKGEKFERK
jgi:hypothetical protein